MRYPLIALTLLAGSQIAHAETDPLVSIGLHFAPISNAEPEPSPKADGYGFGLRAQVGGPLHIHAEYTRGFHDEGGNDVDITDTRLGMGYRHRLANGYIQASAEYAGIKLENGGSDTEQGLGVHIGAGLNVADNIVAYGRVGILTLDDVDGPEMRLGVSGKLGEGATVFGEYRSLKVGDSGADLSLSDLRLGISFSF
jgi:hypothetical protein